VPADYDVVIVGTGMGGATLAYALSESDLRVLLVERGDHLPQEDENWSARAVFVDGRYKPRDRWQDASTGRWFAPGVHYWVGGNTKVYGASLPRFQPGDFGAAEHADGVSPAWPFAYADLERYYDRAEEIFGVHGETDDPGAQRRRPYPHPSVPHERVVGEIATRLHGAGYTPSHIPLGIDLGPGGACIRTSTCDGFPCRRLAKADADVRCVRPALARGRVEMRTRTFARRLVTDSSGARVEGVEVERAGETETIAAGTVVVACGAVNSAALLLRSATPCHPDGLANGSGAVGRHYMVHNNSVMLAIHPTRRNDVVFQKTLYVNDFYNRGTSDHPYPLGHMQLIGKLRWEMLAGQRRFAPRWALRYAASHSVDWWLFTEDLPDPENRVTLTDGGAIRVRWRPNNVRAHEVLVREARRMARASGYPLAVTQRAGIAVNSHQAGTVRAGADPGTSALDPFCKAHELENLYVVDSSFFPSLPVMNPALTIAANALRVADHLLEAHA
jgi:choline dehydrogenase-like flavoprotein